MRQVIPGPLRRAIDQLLGSVIAADTDGKAIVALTFDDEPGPGPEARLATSRERLVADAIRRVGGAARGVGVRVVDLEQDPHASHRGRAAALAEGHALG